MYAVVTDEASPRAVRESDMGFTLVVHSPELGYKRFDLKADAQRVADFFTWRFKVNGLGVGFSVVPDESRDRPKVGAAELWV